MTFSWDRDLLLWDYDPNRLLEDEKLNPEFVELAHQALHSAVGLGLRPRVHEAYRSPAESDRKNSRWRSGKGGRAAPGWRSVHNYGLAMDVWLYDQNSRHIEPPAKGWYRQYKLLAKACSAFIWGEPFDDADHFEYHPKWAKPAGGDLLLQARTWAQKAASGGAAAGPSDISETKWLPFFWWVAGARGGDPPPDRYLASNRPPVQG